MIRKKKAPAPAPAPAVGPMAAQWANCAALARQLHDQLAAVACSLSENADDLPAYYVPRRQLMVMVDVWDRLAELDTR